MDLDLYIFVATEKSQKKCKIYILDGAVDNQVER